VRVQQLAIVAVAVSSFLGLGSAWGQDQQPSAQTSQQASQPAEKKPNWKDRAEYDLVQSALKEADPQKKLELLNQWKEKYPETDFKEMRLEAYIETYQALKQPAKMFDTAKELLALNPKNLKALYWISVLAVSPAQTSPEVLDLAQKAATGLLNAEKPVQTPEMPDEQWKASQAQMAIVAHRTLGWVYMQRKDYVNAQNEFMAELKAHPADSEAVYWLASVLRSRAEDEKKPELLTQALFFFARAVAYDGPGSFDPTRRKQLEAWLQKAYESYHGVDAGGFQALLATAKTNPFPPEGFKILSAAEVAQLKMDQLKQSDPALALWVIVKQELTGTDGATYFNDRMKGALVPPETDPAFKGKVISQEPARAPKVIVVAIEDGKTPDATLRLDVAMPRPAEPGTQITFRGVASSFTAQPFMVSFDVEKKNITGWPAPPPPVHHPVHRPRK
jgi:tetratricopeptide (TPR) repeat protein